jgi:hypothetical protein
VIQSALYRAPELLDPVRHGALKISALQDWSITRHMHAVYVAATELPQAALEFPVLFVHSGDRDAGGRATVSPVALLGLAQGENLYVDGTRWLARYVPAFLRRYPFLTGRAAGDAAPGVMIDTAWSGLSHTVGEALFDAQGWPAPALQRHLALLERFEAEALRTRQFCAQLVDLELLRPMQADATLPDGQTLTVEGFQLVDEEKLRALPEPAVLELHRNGMLMLMHLHIASLANMPALVERKARREQKRQGCSHGPQ